LRVICFFEAQAESGLLAEAVRDEIEEPILTGVSRHKCFEPRLNGGVLFAEKFAWQKLWKSRQTVSFWLVP